MVLLTPDVSSGAESAALKFSRLILSGVASIMCSASVIMFTCFIGEIIALLNVSAHFVLIVWPSDKNVTFGANKEANGDSKSVEG